MIESISEATDVLWYGKKPKGIERVVVFNRSDLSPTPFIVGRALAGEKNDPIGMILSKLHQEEPVQIADDFVPAGWPLWVVDNTLIVFTASWPTMAWFLKNTTNGWLYCYQPTRDTCALAHRLGAKSMTFLTTAHLNAYLGADVPTLEHDDFFVYQMNPEGVQPILEPEGRVGMELCAWLFTWLFSCFGGEATIVGSGGDSNSLLSWDAIMLFKAYLNESGIECDEKHLRTSYAEFKTAEGEAMLMGEKIADDLLKRLNKGDNEGPMFG